MTESERILSSTETISLSFPYNRLFNVECLSRGRCATMGSTRNTRAKLVLDNRTEFPSVRAIAFGFSTLELAVFGYAYGRMVC
jgi:hypothetical protein